MRKLFQCRKTDNPKIKAILNVDIYQRKLSPFQLFAQGEKRGIKSALVRLNFWLMSKGEAMIFSAYSREKELVHTSIVVPKCYKYDFCSEEDYVIGPCQTVPAFRGKGIYPRVICHIMETIGSENTVFYMVASHDNEKSIRGIQKAGFVGCGTILTEGVLKKYIRQGETEDEDSGLAVL